MTAGLQPKKTKPLIILLHNGVKRKAGKPRL